jgi:hypothetical protein
LSEAPITATALGLKSASIASHFFPMSFLSLRTDRILLI